MTRRQRARTGESLGRPHLLPALGPQTSHSALWGLTAITGARGGKPDDSWGLLADIPTNPHPSSVPRMPPPTYPRRPHAQGLRQVAGRDWKGLLPTMFVSSGKKSFPVSPTGAVLSPLPHKQATCPLLGLSQAAPGRTGRLPKSRERAQGASEAVLNTCRLASVAGAQGVTSQDPDVPEFESQLHSAGCGRLGKLLKLSEHHGLLHKRAMVTVSVPPGGYVD